MDRQIQVITDAEPVVTSGARGSEDVGGGFGTRSDGGLFRSITLSADGLRDQVSNLVEVVQYVFSHTLEKPDLSLDQIELSVEISSEGQISILGTGGKAGGRGAIKLVFKRPPQPVAKIAVAAGEGHAGAEAVVSKPQ